MSDAPAPRRSVEPWVIAPVALVGLLAVAGWVYLQEPTDHWQEVAKARAYLKRGQPDLAFRAVSGIRDEAPGAAEGLTLAAHALLMRGNVSTARRALERSLMMKADQAEAAKMLAAIYLASGDGPRGIELLQRAARLEPRDFRPWYAMGKVYHDLGSLTEAADAYARALERSPPPAETIESRIGRIRALLDANLADEATADLAAARSVAPDDPRVLGLAARQSRALGRKDEALELADRTLAADPENVEALLVRAQFRCLSGQPDQALGDLQRAARVNPNHLGVLQLLFQAQSMTGLTRDAAETEDRLRRARERTARMDQLTKEINQHPDDPEPRWRMGQAAVEGGLDTLAYQCFQAALDIDPNHKPSRLALESLRARMSLNPTKRPPSADASTTRPLGAARDGRPQDPPPVGIPSGRR